MNSKYKLAAISLAMSCLTLVTVALTVPDSFDNFLTLNAACSHEGNHYTEHNASVTECGCKEYWVCCTCHEHFVGSQPAGNWKDTGRANIDFDPKNENDIKDSRYLPMVTTTEMEKALKNLGFSSVTNNGDGTYSVGSFNDKNYQTCVIPEGVTKIQVGTFKGNKVKWVVIPYSIEICDNITTTGQEGIVYYFVGTTNKTPKDLACSVIYQVQDVGWHYNANGEPTPGANPSN